MDIRRHLRGLALSFVLLVLLPILIDMVGHFFIALAEEYKWYEHPSEKLAAGMAIISLIVASQWFHWIGGGIVGFAIGVWLDALLKRREESTVSNPVNEPMHRAPSLPLGIVPIPAAVPTGAAKAETGVPNEESLERIFLGKDITPRYIMGFLIRVIRLWRWPNEPRCTLENGCWSPETFTTYLLCNQILSMYLLSATEKT